MVENVRPPDPCCPGGDVMLSPDEARRRVVSAIVPVSQTECLPLAQVLHRVLAQPVFAKVDVPSATNSAMDGYGCVAADLARPGARLVQIGESFAGHPFDGRVKPGQCVRIMTGAVVPDGVDTVVMQENTTVENGAIFIHAQATAGENIRPAGEDLIRGDSVLAVGSYLRPADVAVLASVGATEVEVFRRPRIAFFSTGDELRPLDVDLAPGELYDSNRHGLAAQIRELGMEGIDLGVVGDSRRELEAAFERAVECDAVITSGGVSVGEADWVRRVLQDKGEIDFWRVAMKPGKPPVFGTLGRARFFGLPGNPVSTAVVFLQLVRPALVKLAGGIPADPVRFELPTALDIRKRPGRTHFLRARLDFSVTPPRVVPVDHQGSGVMRSMSRADAFIVLSAESCDVPAGTSVIVEPFAQPVWGLPSDPGHAGS